MVRDTSAAAVLAEALPRSVRPPEEQAITSVALRSNQDVLPPRSSAREPVPSVLLALLIGFVGASGVPGSPIFPPPTAGPVSPTQLTGFQVNASYGEVSSPHGCGGVPVDVQFVSRVEGGVAPFAYNWSFGDGSPNATSADPLHAYATYGRYAVALRVVDAQQQPAVANFTLTLAPPPCPPVVRFPYNVAPVPIVYDALLVAVAASVLGYLLFRAHRHRRTGGPP
jgi:PKD domain